MEPKIQKKAMANRRHSCSAPFRADECMKEQEEGRVTPERSRGERAARRLVGSLFSEFLSALSVHFRSEHEQKGLEVVSSSHSPSWKTSFCCY